MSTKKSSKLKQSMYDILVDTRRLKINDVTETSIGNVCRCSAELLFRKCLEIPWNYPCCSASFTVSLVTIYCLGLLKNK